MKFRKPILVLAVMSVAILACGFFAGSDPTQSEDATLEPSTGDDNRLQPGGTMEGVDGVTIAAPEGALEGEVEMNITSASSPLDQIPLPYGVTVEGRFYQLSAVKDVFTHTDDYLVIGLPISEQKDNLAIAVLVPEEFVDDQGEDDEGGYVWSFVDGYYDPDSELLLGIIALVPEQGILVAVVSGNRFETMASQAPTMASGGKNAALVNYPILQNQPEFTAECHPEFDDPDVPEECTDEILTSFENALQDAYFDYTGMGFNLPRLYREPETIVAGVGNATVELGPYLITVKPCSEHRLDNGTTLGKHDRATATIWACVETTGFSNKVRDTIRHEYFHATQYSYPKILGGDNPAWFIESMAAASERSNTTFMRSTFRGVRDVDLSLIRRPQRYLTEDFWIYLGLREGRGFILMETFLENGGRPDQVDQTLQDLGFGSFGANYWDWAKNQAFEKQVNLGGNNANPICGLSTNSAGGYYAFKTSDENPTGAPPKVNYSHIAPPDPETFTLPPLTSKVYEISFEALDVTPYTTEISVSSNSSSVRVKYYDIVDSGTNACQTKPDGRSRPVSVPANQNMVIYALVANTSITQSVQATLEFDFGEAGLRILSPFDGSVFNEGETIEYSAVATGFTGGDSDLIPISWRTIRYDGVPYTFGSSNNGEIFPYANLCDGTWVITAEAIDARTSQTYQDEITITINDLGTTNPPEECAVSIDIIEPLTLSTISVGQSLDLRAVIDDDHPETDEPLYPVIWRVGGPEGRIIGRGLVATTKVAEDMQTIYVTYGAAFDVTNLAVIEGNEPPVVRIQTPDDEEIFREQAALIYVDFVAVAIDPEDGHISEDIIWEYRLSGSTERMTFAGVGPEVTISFPAECSLTGYEIRAWVQDQARTSGQDLVKIYVRGPEC